MNGRRVVSVVVVRGVVEVGEGVGVGGDGVEDAADGADEVEVDDGAPGDAFGVECGGGVEELEFWGRETVNDSDRWVEEWNAWKMWK